MTDIRIPDLSNAQNAEIEGWIVNSVKLNLISKYDSWLEHEGRVNLRKLLLVPVFSVSDMEKRVKEKAPELVTVFYKELSSVMALLTSKMNMKTRANH